MMMKRWQVKVAILLLIWLGAALRWHGLFANTFEADEALFAGWARLIAVGRDPLLRLPPVDKPPLLFYLQAFFYPLLATPQSWPARLPNLVASILTIALTARLAWSLYRQPLVAFLATGVIALSPLAIQFSASAFTDPLMLAFLLGALLLTRPAPRPGVAVASGVAFGLAIATKYQAGLFLPLLLGTGMLAHWNRRTWLRWAVGLGVVLGVLIAWEVARTGDFTLLSNQWTSYGGVRLAHAWELWPRLDEWGTRAQFLLGSEVVAFAVLLGLPIFLALTIHDRDWDAAYDQLLIIFILGYLVLHWFLAVPIWDRYVLPLLPLVAILLGRFAQRVITFVGLPYRPAALFAGLSLALLLLPGASEARLGAWPIGTSPQADGGAAEIAAQLAAAPYGTVLYDHWYSWQWAYYFIDRGVYVSWFPHPAALAEDLHVFGADASARYLVVPQAPVAAPVLRAVAQSGYSLEPIHRAGEMILYRIHR